MCRDCGQRPNKQIMPDIERFAPPFPRKFMLEGAKGVGLDELGEDLFEVYTNAVGENPCIVGQVKEVLPLVCLHFKAIPGMRYCASHSRRGNRHIVPAHGLERLIATNISIVTGGGVCPGIKGRLGRASSML